MTPDDFRRIALALPEAIESAHGGHPDFRVGSRIFATLAYPDTDCGMVQLTPEQQELFLRVAPEAFEPSVGAWGRRGSTRVRLARAKKPIVRDALTTAWRNRASKKLAAAFDAAARRSV